MLAFLGGQVRTNYDLSTVVKRSAWKRVHTDRETGFAAGTCAGRRAAAVDAARLPLLHPPHLLRAGDVHPDSRRRLALLRRPRVQARRLCVAVAVLEWGLRGPPLRGRRRLRLWRSEGQGQPRLRPPRVSRAGCPAAKTASAIPMFASIVPQKGQ